MDGLMYRYAYRPYRPIVRRPYGPAPLMPYAPFYMAIGQEPAPAPAPPAPAPAPTPLTPQQQAEKFNLEGITSALKQVTPSLLLVGVATGMAFAIGSHLASYVLNRK